MHTVQDNTTVVSHPYKFMLQYYLPSLTASISDWFTDTGDATLSTWIKGCELSLKLPFKRLTDLAGNRRLALSFG